MTSIKRYLFLIACLLFVQAQETPKLVFIQEIFRHGARYPESTLYPNLNDLFAKQQMSLGELTSQGRSMHYLLGKKMYDTYWKKLFAGTPYEFRYNQSKFFVQSTDVNRTIESAESHLYGLLESLPPLTISKEQAKFANPPYPGVEAKAGYVFGQKVKFYHPMAVHVQSNIMTPTDHGDFLATFLASDCPNQESWIKQNNQNQTAASMLNNPAFLNALGSLEISLNLPKNTITLSNFYKYYDNLICMKYLGKDVPELIVTPSESKRALDALQSLNAVITFYFNDKQIRASSTGFFQQTIKNIKSYIQTKNSPQWVIYSAHDITLGMTFAAMNLWNADCIFENYIKNITDPQTCITTFPAFSSVLVFEVYEYSNNSYTFKINYNGRHLQIPFCDYRTECEVSKFESWFQSWRVADVRLACGVFNKYRKEIFSTLVGSILMVILIIILHFVIPSDTKGKFLKKIFGKQWKKI